MHKIEFRQSGKTIAFTSEFESILECAEANDLDLEYGCREGNCTACQQRILNGEVEYPNGHSGVPDEGNQLLCCSKPKSDLIIDA